MAGQALLASAVVDWKKNKALGASAKHCSSLFPDVMIHVTCCTETISICLLDKRSLDKLGCYFVSSLCFL